MQMHVIRSELSYTPIFPAGFKSMATRESLFMYHLLCHHLVTCIRHRQALFDRNARIHSDIYGNLVETGKGFDGRMRWGSTACIFLVLNLFCAGVAYQVPRISKVVFSDSSREDTTEATYAYSLHLRTSTLHPCHPTPPSPYPFAAPARLSGGRRGHQYLRENVWRSPRHGLSHLRFGRLPLRPQGRERRP